MQKTHKTRERERESNSQLESLQNSAFPRNDNVSSSLQGNAIAKRGKTRQSRSFFSNLNGIANDGQNAQLATTRDCHESACSDSRNDETIRDCHDFASQNLAMTGKARDCHAKASPFTHNDKQSIKLFLALYLFFFVLNALFPAQSDDLGVGIGGLKAMANSYLNWNGRLGELVRIWFGSFLAHTPYFAFINASFCVALLYLLFVLIFGRLPRCLPSVYENLDSKNAQIQVQPNKPKSSAIGFDIPSDVAVLCFMLLAFMAYKGFGAVFFWVAGSLNYLWAYCLILGFCVPYRMLGGRMYERKCTKNMQNQHNAVCHTEPLGKVSRYDNDSVIASEQSERGNPLELQENFKNTPLENQQDCHDLLRKSRNDKKIKESIKASAMLFLGILAGWSSEFGIVLAIFLIGFMIYAICKGVKLPLWAYCGIIGFIAGFCALYFSPGHRSRAERFAEVLDYVSLSKLWAMSLSEKYARLANAFRGNITKTLLMQCATLGIIALLVKRRHITQLVTFSLVVYFVLLCVKWGSVGYFAYLFAPSVAGLCVFAYVRERALHSANFENLDSENARETLDSKIAGRGCENSHNTGQNLDSRNAISATQTPANPALFLALAGLCLAHFLATAASIQVGLPPRAKLIWVLLGMAMCIALARIYAPFLSERAKSAIKNLVCLSCAIFALFVLYASVDMRLKWERMLASIDAQKALGRQEIVVNKEVFSSFYYGYTDWGNPNEKVNEWPNTSYARFFKVEKFIAE